MPADDPHDAPSGPVVPLTPELIEDSNAVLADLVGDPLPERGDADAVEWHNMLVEALNRKVSDGLRELP